MKDYKMLEKFLISLFCVLVLAVPCYAVETDVSMSEVHEADSHNYTVVEDGITDSYGNEYKDNVLRFDASNGAFVSYDLNGGYDTFKGTIVASNQTGSGASLNVGIFADGHNIYSMKGFTRQRAGEEFELDVSGVRTLDIRTSNSGDYSYGWIFFVNSSFSTSESPAYTDWSSLSDLVLIDSARYNSNMELFTDSFGEFHDGRLYFDASNNSFALYNLNKDYVTFTGSIVTAPNTGSEASMSVRFLCDDEEVFSKSEITKITPLIPFSIDVTNVSVLRIETTNQGAYSNGHLFVTDDILKSHVHTPGEWVIATEPTCTESGIQERYCQECNELIDSEIIPPTGHTSDGVWVTTREATCSAEGEEVQHCTVCGEVSETRTLEKTPHNPSAEWTIVKEATCQQEGVRKKVCAVCNETVEQEVIAKTEHTFGAWRTVSGSIWNNPIVKTRVCSVCGFEERTESNPTSWLKPLVTVLILIVLGGFAVICVTLRMNGLALHPDSIRVLFSKETLTDDDVEKILNKDKDSSKNTR